MKKMYELIKSKRYFSFLTITLLVSTFLTSIRYYVFDNLMKTPTLANLGGFAQKIFISALLIVSSILGILLGVGFFFVRYKKRKTNFSNSINIICMFFAMFLLFLTPYNVKILFPNQNMQNLAMINYLVFNVVYIVNMLLLTLTLIPFLAIGSEEKSLGKCKKISIDVIVKVCILVFAVIMSVCAISFKWEIKVCLTVYVAMFAGASIVGLFNNSNNNFVGYNKSNSIALSSVVTFTIAVLLMVGYLFCNKYVAITIF